MAADGCHCAPYVRRAGCWGVFCVAWCMHFSTNLPHFLPSNSLTLHPSPCLLCVCVCVCMNTVARALCWCIVCVFCVFYDETGSFMYFCMQICMFKSFFSKKVSFVLFFTCDGYPAEGRPHGGLCGFPQPCCDAQTAVNPWVEDCMSVACMPCNLCVYSVACSVVWLHFLFFLCSNTPI